jgi:hypothetical protein
MFTQEMKLVFPNSQRINRGGMILNELVETCRSHDFTDIVVLHEHRGEPGMKRGISFRQVWGACVQMTVQLELPITYFEDKFQMLIMRQRNFA